MRLRWLGFLSLVSVGCRPRSEGPCVAGGPFTVGECGFDDLSGAVLAAWVDDGLVAVSPGTYEGSVRIGVPEQAVVDEVRIEGSGATFDAGGVGPAFVIGAVALRIEDVTITGGSGLANATGGESSGGGVYADQDARLTLVNAVVTGNHADFGGGIFGTQLVLDTTTVEDNQAMEAGGGIYVYGAGSDPAAVTLSRSSVTGNSAPRGGGLFVANHTVELEDSTVEGNLASGDGGAGGGAALYGGRLVGGVLRANEAALGGGAVAWTGSSMSSSLFEGNEASKGGGGLYVGPIDGSGGSVVVDGLDLESNSAPVGAGIAVDRMELDASTTTVASNSATEDGGGIAVVSGDFESVYLQAGLTLESCTLSGNQADADGGGLWVADGAAVVGDGTEVSANQAARGGGLAVIISSCGAPAVTLSSGASVVANVAPMGAGAYVAAGTLYVHAGASFGEAASDNVGPDVTVSGSDLALGDESPEQVCATQTSGCHVLTDDDLDMDGVDAVDDCDATDVCVQTCD